MKPYGYVHKDGEGLFIYGEHQFQNAMNAELVPVYTKDAFLQLIKEIRPAIKPLEGMGKGKTAHEWFDILVAAIEKNT